MLPPAGRTTSRIRGVRPIRDARARPVTAQRFACQGRMAAQAWGNGPASASIYIAIEEQDAVSGSVGTAGWITPCLDAGAFEPRVWTTRDRSARCIAPCQTGTGKDLPSQRPPLSADRPLVERAPHVVHVFPSFAVGGAQMRFAALANRFGRSFRHSVIALDGDLGCRDRLASGLAIDFPPVPAPKDAMVGNALRFRRLLRALAPD